MKACTYQSPERFAVEDVPIPVIGPGEILVETRVVGVCGTDVHKALHRTVPPGTVLGHEIAGVVKSVGERVETFRPGDPVAIAHHAPCMSCKLCLKGRHSLCPQYLKTNVHPGGFSEYIRLPPENVKHTVRRIPAGTSFKAAAFMEPLACCLRGFHRFDVSPGDSYLVIGLGPIGMQFCQIAAAFNAGTIIGIDPDSFRRQFALNNLHVSEANAPSHSSKDSPARFDHVIVTAGSGKAYQAALDGIGRGTEVLVFAECPEGHQVTLDPNVIYRNEAVLAGSYSSSPRFLAMAIDMIGSGAIDVEQLVTHVLPPERLAEAIALAASAGESLKVMISFE